MEWPAAADASRLDFDHRGRVVQRLLEDLERIAARTLIDDVERSVKDPLGAVVVVQETLQIE